MKCPLIRHYADSVMQPFGLFRTLGEFRCLTDRHGEPEMRVGGNAVVFKVSIGDEPYALKCYLKPKTGLRQRVEYINSTEDGLFDRLEYLHDEITVFDSPTSYLLCDVLLSRWIDGHSLDYAVRKAVMDNDAGRMCELAERFDRLACRLLECEWAHGDLKPENIMIDHCQQMRLIDCDALFVPSIEPSGETGTWTFQHPRRTAAMYDKHVDDYSIALISASLHALAHDISLGNRFNAKADIFFLPDDIVAHRSEAYAEVCRTFARKGDAALLGLCRTLDRPTPAIPELKEIIESLHSIPLAADWRQLSAFRKGYLWGYCNRSGKTVIAPLFDSAMEYRNGAAKVSLMGYGHIIDSQGAVIDE